MSTTYIYCVAVLYFDMFMGIRVFILLEHCCAFFFVINLLFYVNQKRAVLSWLHLFSFDDDFLLKVRSSSLCFIRKIVKRRQILLWLLYLCNGNIHNTREQECYHRVIKKISAFQFVRCRRRTWYEQSNFLSQIYICVFLSRDLIWGNNSKIRIILTRKK